MVKKRVEEGQDNIVIDDTIEEIPMREIPKNVKVEKQVEKKAVEAPANGPINCLRDERVIVRFVPRPTSMVQNPKHILYGGMADTATRSFVVPRLTSTGIYKNVLTDNEKAYLEQVMGLEYNALSIYKKENNFWDDSNEAGIGRVVLHKQDNYLDLSVPTDYIKYKILLANKNEIASSPRELEENPKATYQFVIISENNDSRVNISKADMITECYMEFGRIRGDIDTLRTVVEMLEGRPISSKTKMDFLQGRAMEFIQSKPKLFLSVVKDETLDMKVFIKKCVEEGLIAKKNDCYFLKADNSPLCEANEDSTLNNAVRYLGSPRRQELKFMLEAKLKEK